MPKAPPAPPSPAPPLPARRRFGRSPLSRAALVALAAAIAGPAIAQPQWPILHEFVPPDPNEDISFDEAYLHDAVLGEIRVDWQHRTCAIFLSVFLDVGKAAVPCVLRGRSVRSITIPHIAPWGDSVFISG